MAKPSELTLPAAIENLTALKDFINGELDAFGLDPRQCLQVELACDELLTNIILYAYPKPPGDITVRCQPLDAQSFQVTIIDSGVHFDPLATERPDTALALEDRPLGGLGILLSREMVDNITYERQNDSNILTITKNKASSRKP